jgi:hypothetical protein
LIVIGSSHSQVGFVVLKEIDAARVRGMKGDILARVVKDVMLRELPIRKESAEEDLRRDRLSHFILRLAFADTYDRELCVVCHCPDQGSCREDHRRWFIEKECTLFRYRCCMRFGFCVFCNLISETVSGFLRRSSKSDCDSFKLVTLISSRYRLAPDIFFPLWNADMTLFQDHTRASVGLSGRS